MSERHLHQRGLEKLEEQNINSEIIQEENRADILEEEIIPESSIGVIQRLINVGNKLQDISTNEEDPDKRELYYQDVSADLDRLTTEIQQMMDMLGNQADQIDVNEIIIEFTQAIDAQFLGASQLFLSAVEYYYNFIETEDPLQLQEAQNRIEEGTIQLEQADVSARAMGEILTSTSGTFEQA